MYSVQTRYVQLIITDTYKNDEQYFDLFIFKCICSRYIWIFSHSLIHTGETIQWNFCWTFLLWKWKYWKMSQRKSLSFSLFFAQKKNIYFHSYKGSDLEYIATQIWLAILLMCVIVTFPFIEKVIFDSSYKLPLIHSSFTFNPCVYLCIYVCIVFNSQVQSISMSLLLLSESLLCFVLDFYIIRTNFIWFLLPLFSSKIQLFSMWTLDTELKEMTPRQNINSIIGNTPIQWLFGLMNAEW